MRTSQKTWGRRWFKFKNTKGSKKAIKSVKIGTTRMCIPQTRKF